MCYPLHYSHDSNSLRNLALSNYVLPTIIMILADEMSSWLFSWQQQLRYLALSNYVLPSSLFSWQQQFEISCTVELCVINNYYNIGRWDVLLSVFMFATIEISCICYQHYYDTGRWGNHLTSLMTSTIEISCTVGLLVINIIMTLADEMSSSLYFLDIEVSSSRYTWQYLPFLWHLWRDFHLFILMMLSIEVSSSPSWHFQMKSHSYPTHCILTLSTTVYDGDSFTPIS